MSALGTVSRSYTVDEGLARLIAGNERFVRGEARFPTVQKEILAQLATGQRPYATIIGAATAARARRGHLRTEDRTRALLVVTILCALRWLECPASAGPWAA